MNTLVPLILSKIEPINRVSRHIVARIAEQHTVTRGDTLSGIVREYLIANGREHSTRDVYNGVQHVAKMNQLQNADRIFIGQKIHLDIPAPRVEPSFPQMLDVVVKEARPVKTESTSELFGKVLEGPAKLSSPFGRRKNPVARGHRIHNGVDLAATRNTPITSMRSGTVSFSGWMRGYGNTIIVKHEDGIETQYSHAAKRMVDVGDRVNKETVVGLVGSTGNATGPHLHFEVKRNGRAVNPIPYLLSNPTPRTRISFST